jgi:hypothetical protein
MFRSSADHLQEAYLFLVKNHLIKIRVFICGDVVMQQHNMHLFYVVNGVDRYAVKSVTFYLKKQDNTYNIGVWGSVVVKALRYSSDGPGIDSR